MTELFEASLDERIRAFVSREPELDSARRTSLAGDASNRLYFRLTLPDGRTRILSCLPQPFEARSLPFLQVHDLFQKIPLPVPRVLRVSGSLGIVLLEDLGDRLLQEEGGPAATEERRRELYREAVDLLVRLQLRGRELEPEGALPFRTAFDTEKFLSELQFFRVHFLQGLRGAELSDFDAGELDAEFRDLSSELVAQPYALCHRDYHSRNLIVGDTASLSIIDFQDARMGPRCYDLVSLLNDSYLSVDPDLVVEMKERFARAVEADVASEYDLAALQRNLKALGTFGYQISGRKNEVYRPYLAHTLRLVRANLERNPRWDRLRRSLSRHLPELA